MDDPCNLIIWATDDYAYLGEEYGFHQPITTSTIVDAIWKVLQEDAEITAVVRSRQLHIYRNGKKILILAGKARPKMIREDKLCELLK